MYMQADTGGYSSHFAYICTILILAPLALSYLISFYLLGISWYNTYFSANPLNTLPLVYIKPVLMEAIGV